MNADIINAIKAIDRKFIEVTDTLYRFKTKNHTFFQNITTQIKYLVSAKRALKMTALNLEKYPDSYSLVTFKNDTIKFLENKLGLEYRNPYPNSMFPIDSMEISLENIKTDHIHFNTTLVNKKIIQVAKKLNLIEQNEFFKYIKRNFTYFSEEDKIVTSTSIRVKYITLGEENVYVGIDIYGVHFLWTISKKQNWDVINIERLWVY